MAFANTSTSLPQGPIPVVDNLIGLGEPLSPNTVDVALCHVYHEGFARKLLRWLDKLQWFPQSQCGTRKDTSWLELFWGFLFDTSLLPPVRHGGEWLTVDDDESIYFVLPPVRNLFAVWKRLLDSLCKGGLSVPWDTRVARVASVGSLGCRFACSGFCGFVPISRSALCDLARCNFMALVAFAIFGSPSLISLVFWLLGPQTTCLPGNRSHFFIETRRMCESVPKAASSNFADV